MNFADFFGNRYNGLDFSTPQWFVEYKYTANSEVREKVENNCYYLTVNAPGYNKENSQVTVDKDTSTVVLSKKDKVERLEFHFTRTNINHKTAAAWLKDGVFTIAWRLLKEDDFRSYTVDIKGE